MPDAATRFDNPFATRWTAPGVLPFLFTAGNDGLPKNDVGLLIDRLQQLDWRAAIVGPHGSGKTTLLAALIPRLKEANREVVPIALHEGECSVPRDAINIAVRSPKGLLVIDGWDQLGPWTRRRVRRRLIRSDHGLLVTSHAGSRLPVLLALKPNLAVVEAVVARLLAGRGPAVPADVIAASFQSHGENVREMLFDLYNWHERDRRQNRGNRSMVIPNSADGT